MAKTKKNGVSKADAIRSYLSSHPDAKTKEIRKPWPAKESRSPITTFI
jgi:hypothetical protein